MSHTVTSAPPPSAITLDVSVRKIKNLRYANLSWSPTKPTERVDISRGYADSISTENDGSYTDGPFPKGVNSAIYQVCEAGTQTCSNEVTVSW